MKGFLIGLGFGMILIFGGGFLIRLIQDSSFLIVEFIVGIIGIVILATGIFIKGKVESNGSSL